MKREEVARDGRMRKQGEFFLQDRMWEIKRKLTNKTIARSGLSMFAY